MTVFLTGFGKLDCEPSLSGWMNEMMWLRECGVTPTTGNPSPKLGDNYFLLMNQLIGSYNISG